MSDFLQIQARLPRAAGLELSARILAAHPLWDIELEEDGLSLVIPLINDQPEPATEPTGPAAEEPPNLFPGPDEARPLRAELIEVEEACRHLEKTRGGFTVELEVTEASERQPWPAPVAAGPWRVRTLAEGESPPPPRPDQLVLPPYLRASKRLWAGESLLLTLIAEHLTPPPGAPETRGLPALVLESVLPVAPLAAVLAGASTATLAAEEADCASAVAIAAANAKTSAVETVNQPFKTLVRKQEEWAGHFGLIAVHLSPYLASRRLKALGHWLRPEGSLVISGFAPGPQTAHLLRAAARAGLYLTGSIIEGEWAAMKLEMTPEREELPPLTGSVVPDLVDLPEEETARPDPELAPEPEEEEIPDEDSLMVEEDDLEDEA